MGPNASGREFEFDWSHFVNLELINAWTDDEARESFQRCCGSRRWFEAMARARPFESEAALIETAERIWWALSTADWLEAFGAHPRIGDVDAIRARFAATAAWASREQAGALGASEEVLQNLARGNRQYEDRFGYIFIVCASGKTAEEMLGLLMQRLGNDADAEIKLAAGEQMKITRIRLERIATS
jgi:2-oxo-4-hydroxy-4-carboxy-5-ureidoimidazoline decarboxylase